MTQKRPVKGNELRIPTATEVVALFQEGLITFVEARRILGIVDNFQTLEEVEAKYAQDIAKFNEDMEAQRQHALSHADTEEQGQIDRARAVSEGLTVVKDTPSE